jgi:hypothetical protein
MEILVVGSNGTTGKRYCTILKMLGCTVIEYDAIHARNNQRFSRSDGVIIATPTHLHKEHFERAIRIGNKKILIEKPVSKINGDIEDMIVEAQGMEVTVVCNWKYCTFATLEPESHDITYNYFNHGREEIPIWDMCQLVYLQKGESYDFAYDSPFFVALVDGFPVTLMDIERSYFRMITQWLANPKGLWDLHDAVKMNKKVENYLNP